MISFIIALAVLIAAYFTYGKLCVKAVKPSAAQTPAYTKADGVDYVPMKKWKTFLVQLLNIAGTGPIFGALMGAVFGPVVFLWIVFGSILGGAVHDFFTGIISVRSGGSTLDRIIELYLGKPMRYIMGAFSVVLLLLVGTVFVSSPAALIAKLTPECLNQTFWLVIIFAYYILATLLPIDKIIGKLYPIFGVTLIIMAAAIIVGLLAGGYTLPELTLENLRPDNLPVFPFMFITVACGAVSGFHGTQTPIAARCITSEKEARPIFYGAMLTESIIALVWAAAGVAYYGATSALNDALTTLGQSGVVYDIAQGTLGTIGTILAVIGVVACPITSGDTAFRAARMTISDFFHIDQKKFRNRLFIALPLFAVSVVLTTFDFNIIWRYFSWSNQTLAAISLWAFTAYLVRNGSCKPVRLMTAIPAMFMTFVSVNYILMASEGFGLDGSLGYPLGMVISTVICAAFILLIYSRSKRGLIPADRLE